MDEARETREFMSAPVKPWVCPRAVRRMGVEDSMGSGSMGGRLRLCGGESGQGGPCR